MLSEKAFVTFQHKRDAVKATTAGSVELPDGSVVGIIPHRYRSLRPNAPYKIYRDDNTVISSEELQGYVPGAEDMERTTVFPTKFEWNC